MRSSWADGVLSLNFIKTPLYSRKLKFRRLKAVNARSGGRVPQPQQMEPKRRLHLVIPEQRVT